MKCTYCKKEAIRIVHNFETDQTRAACKDHLLYCLREGRVLTVVDASLEGQYAQHLKESLEQRYPEL